VDYVIREAKGCPYRVRRGHEDTTTTSQFDLLVGFSMLIELWQSRVRTRKADIRSKHGRVDFPLPGARQRRVHANAPSNSKNTAASWRALKPARLKHITIDNAINCQQNKGSTKPPTHHLLITKPKPTRKSHCLQSSLLLGLSQRNVSPGPKVAQISHREVDAQPHFGSHHHKCHVPAT
jgi:hypothetical protein